MAELLESLSIVEVHIWEGVYGHAALKIITPDHGETYISFHPATDKNKVNRFHKLSGLGDIVGTSAPVYLALNIEDDKHIIGRKPDRTIILINLNGPAMLTHWKNIRNNNPRYKVLLNNCSTVTAQCLAIGWVGTLDGYKNGNITKKEMKQKLQDLKKIIKSQYTAFAISRSSVIGSVNITLKIVFLFNVILMLFFFPWVGTGMVFSTYVLDYWVIGDFDLYFWEPSLVHKIALFLDKKQREDIWEKYGDAVMRKYEGLTASETKI